MSPLFIGLTIGFCAGILITGVALYSALLEIRNAIQGITAVKIVTQGEAVGVTVQPTGGIR